MKTLAVLLLLVCGVAAADTLILNSWVVESKVNVNTPGPKGTPTPMVDVTVHKQTDYDVDGVKWKVLGPPVVVRLTKSQAKTNTTIKAAVAKIYPTATPTQTHYQIR